MPKYAPYEHGWRWTFHRYHSPVSYMKRWRVISSICLLLIDHFILLFLDSYHVFNRQSIMLSRPILSREIARQVNEIRETLSITLIHAGKRYALTICSDLWSDKFRKSATSVSPHISLTTITFYIASTYVVNLKMKSINKRTTFSRLKKRNYRYT
jgi:hypothetical protein